uniref:Uncharacterized protein n=1 Tax=Lactuca sativa TaxID=4236 RepID=A0A9R1WQN4_LACSA|nr:hypothetical protein LSAT_V11C900500370 [Lactuca sativa]
MPYAALKAREYLDKPAIHEIMVKDSNNIHSSLNIRKDFDALSTTRSQITKPNLGNIQQMKEEEERSKTKKGKEGATVDLMQVLLASTKEVKEQNDGFVDVVKKTKGNNGNLFSKEATGGGGGKQFSSQGHQGNFSKNEGSGVFAGTVDLFFQAPHHPSHANHSSVKLHEQV